MRYRQSILLRDGETITLRSLEKRDAAQAIWILRKTTGETDFLLRETDECGMTIAQEEEYIARMLESPREAIIGAFVGEELTGMANLSMTAPRLRVRHRAQMGISLVKACWGRGIGTAMLRALTELAKEAGYEQMELEVACNNERAIALYRRFGFETVGRLPHAMKYRDGSYADLLVMVRRLGEN